MGYLKNRKVFRHWSAALVGAGEDPVANEELSKIAALVNPYSHADESRKPIFHFERERQLGPNSRKRPTSTPISSKADVAERAGPDLNVRIESPWTPIAPFATPAATDTIGQKSRWGEYIPRFTRVSIGNGKRVKRCCGKPKDKPSGSAIDVLLLSPCRPVGEEHPRGQKRIGATVGLFLIRMRGLSAIGRRRILPTRSRRLGEYFNAS